MNRKMGRTMIDEREPRREPASASKLLALYEQELSRRGFVRVFAGGAAGLAVAATGTRGLVAQDATPDVGGSVTVYSGRNENLIGPLIPMFESATGVEAEVRYGGTAELAATILEEGDNSPADVFLAQDAGALGALAREGRLRQLPDEILERVEPRFRSPDGLWVGLSGRARVAVYNTEMLAADELPDSVRDLTDEQWRGMIGWAPENASFQSFVTALRVLDGEEAAREWLEGMLANEPIVFEGNSPIVRAVAAGEVPLGLVNHYYLYEIEAEEGELPIENHFFAADDPGSLINVAGIGILDSAENTEQAEAMVDYLLSEEGQTFFATETYEYPLIEGIPAFEGLVPLDEIQSPDIDLTDLDDLQGTLDLLTDVGAL